MRPIAYPGRESVAAALVDSLVEKSLGRLGAATSASTLPTYIKDDVEANIERLTKELEKPGNTADHSNAVGFLSDRIRDSLRSDASLKNLAARTFDGAAIGGSPWKYLPLALICVLAIYIDFTELISWMYIPEVLLPALIGWLALRFGIRMLPVLIVLGWFVVWAVDGNSDVFAMTLGVPSATYVICLFIALSLAPELKPGRLCHERWAALRWVLLGLICAAVVLEPWGWESDDSQFYGSVNVPILLAILVLAFALDWAAALRGIRQILQYREWARAPWLAGLGAVALILAMTGTVSMESDDPSDVELIMLPAIVVTLCVGILLFLVRRVSAPWLLVGLMMAVFLGIVEADGMVAVTAGIAPTFGLLFGFFAGLSILGRWRLAVGVLAVVIAGALGMDWWNTLGQEAANTTAPAESSLDGLEEILLVETRRFDWLAAALNGLGAIAAGTLVSGFLHAPYQATPVDLRRSVSVGLLALYVCVVLPRFGWYDGVSEELLHAVVAFMAGRLWSVRAIVAAPIVFPILTLIGPDSLDPEWLAWQIAPAVQLAIVYFLWSIFGLLSNRLTPPQASAL